MSTYTKSSSMQDIAGSVSAAGSSNAGRCPHHTVSSRSVSPLVEQPPSTTTTSRKRPNHWDVVLNNSPPTKQRKLDLPSIDVLLSDNYLPPIPRGFSNTLALDFSPLSQASTAFEASPARSTISLVEDEELTTTRGRFSTQEKGKGKQSSQLIRSASSTSSHMRWGSRTSPTRDSDEVDELYAEGDVAAPRPRSPHFPLLPVMHPSLPPRLCSPFHFTFTASSPTAIQQPLASCTSSPASAYRPLSASSTRSASSFHAGGESVTSSYSKLPGSPKKQIDGEFRCNYASPLGGPACNTDIGKKADLLRHIGEKHARTEAKLVLGGELDLGRATTYLQDLASIISKSDDKPSEEGRESDALILQAKAVMRKIKAAGPETALDLNVEGLELFRQAAADHSRLRTHRKWACQDCDKLFESIRSLYRHQEVKRHGRHRDQNATDGSPASLTTSSRRKRSADPTSRSRQLKPKKSTTVGERQDWKVDHQTSLAHSSEQPILMDRRISMDVRMAPFSEQ